MTGMLLGAVELIELGGAERRQSLPQEIFLRGRARLGQGGAIAFLLNGLSVGLGLVSNIVKVPLSFLASGVGTILTSLAGVMSEIPLIGTLVGGLLLVLNAALQFVLEIPGFVLDQLKNLFGYLSKEFQGAFKSEGEQKSKLDEAKELLVGRASPDIKSDVRSKLEARPSVPPPVEELPVGGEVDVTGLAIVGAAAGAAAAFLI